MNDVKPVELHRFYLKTRKSFSHLKHRIMPHIFLYITTNHYKPWGLQLHVISKSFSYIHHYSYKMLAGETRPMKWINQLLFSWDFTRDLILISDVARDVRRYGEELWEAGDNLDNKNRCTETKENKILKPLKNLEGPDFVF